MEYKNKIITHCKDMILNHLNDVITTNPSIKLEEFYKIVDLKVSENLYYIDLYLGEIEEEE